MGAQWCGFWAWVDVGKGNVLADWGEIVEFFADDIRNKFWSGKLGKLPSESETCQIIWGTLFHD